MRFAISEDGEILEFDPEFQREVLDRYLEMNGLSEITIYDANTDWEALYDGCPAETFSDSEKPQKLPDKYKGDVFDELKQIYRELMSIGVWTDLEVIFENMVGQTCMIVDDKEEPLLTLTILKSLGYQTEEIMQDGKRTICIR